MGLSVACPADCLKFRIGMVKYNINFDCAKKDAAYQSLINPKQISRLKVKIVTIIQKKKKYRDKEYSAKQLADELETNTRYISAAVKIGFDMNYTSFVNKCRIDASMALMKNKRNKNLKMEDIGNMVGFSNRQSFYAAFYKFTGMTPKQFKQNLDNGQIEGKEQ